jgi:hypothetical protein
VNDLHRYNIREEALQPLTIRDITKANSLLNSEAMKVQTLWRYLSKNEKKILILILFLYAHSFN